MGLIFTDKRKRDFSPGIIKKRIALWLGFFFRTVFGVFCFFIGINLVFSLAEKGNDIFYYALAFASPGSAVRILETPFYEEEKTLSSAEEETEFFPEEEEEDEIIFLQNPDIVFEIPEENRGKITETQYSAEDGGIYIEYKNAVIKNCSSHSREKILSVLKNPKDFSNYENPAVLIYHTHATESYEFSDSGFFDYKNSDWRSTDPDENMIAVGDSLTAVLAENGIGVIHDGTMHDDPGYNGSYQRSAVTVSAHLSQNENISFCLDIHRDAIEPSKTEIMKPTAVINGKKAAQIMIISGCDDGSMNMPDYWENLRFAAALANKLEELYPGICRPILFDYRKYNMDLSQNLLLIEIGATGNTLEEAKYSAELLGNALAALIAE